MHPLNPSTAPAAQTRRARCINGAAPCSAACSTACRVSDRSGTSATLAAAHGGSLSRSNLRTRPRTHTPLQANMPLAPRQSRSLLPPRARISCAFAPLSKRRAAHALRASPRLTRDHERPVQTSPGHCGVSPRSPELSSSCCGELRRRHRVAVRVLVGDDAAPRETSARRVDMVDTLIVAAVWIAQRAGGLGARVLRRGNWLWA